MNLWIEIYEKIFFLYDIENKIVLLILLYLINLVMI